MPHDAKHVTNTRRLSYYIIAYILSTDVNTKIKNGEAETTISFFCDFSTVFLLKKNSIDFSVFFYTEKTYFFGFIHIYKRYKVAPGSKISIRIGCGRRYRFIEMRAVVIIIVGHCVRRSTSRQPIATLFKCQITRTTRSINAVRIVTSIIDIIVDRMMGACGRCGCWRYNGRTFAFIQKSALITAAVCVWVSNVYVCVWLESNTRLERKLSGIFFLFEV